ncbi:MAG: PP2C family protein-serine/threonine phosphatase, partial [Candidatus Eremiobacterota bacterium]
MISKFLLHQMDYIYFLYGLSLIFLSVVCYTLKREKKSDLPWLWLGLFGLTHGLSKWLEFLTIITGPRPIIEIIKLSLLISSYLFLLNFGRLAITSLKIWIFLPLLCLSFTGIFINEPEGFAIFPRYFLGIPGGILTLITLFLRSRKEKNIYLFIMSGAMFFYIFTIITGVPKGIYFPSTLLNSHTFLSITGIPLQLFQSLLSIVMIISLWLYSQILRCRETVWLSNRKIISYYTVSMVYVLLFILTAGWIAAQLVGISTDREVKNNLLRRARTIASSLDPEIIKILKGIHSDTGTVNYKYIKKQLHKIIMENDDCRFVYLTAIRNDKIVYLADSEPSYSKDYSMPGDIYNSTDMRNIFSGGKPLVAGPAEDKWGTWISAFSPVIDGDTKKVIAVFGMDINAADWAYAIAIDRIDPILITLLISVIVIIFFIIYEISFEASLRIRAAEKERFDSEVRIASDIQMGMIPKIFPPSSGQFSLYALLEPARTVSGDVYDFFMLDKDRLWIAIGDVSGKGIPASLFMVITKILFRFIASQGGSPGTVFTKLNRELYNNNETFMFVTVFAGILNTKTGLLTYINAGHNRPYIIKHKGDIVELEKPDSIALGVDEDVVYADRDIVLEHGDCLFTYTDGVTEAMRETGELFDEHRLVAILKEKNDKHPEEIIQSVHGAIKDFTGNAEQSDDITMLSVKYYNSEQ